MEFRHYDLYGQVLAKVERGYAQDVTDAHELMARGALDLRVMTQFADASRDDLDRYPAIDPAEFARKVARFVQAHAQLDRR